MNWILTQEYSDIVMMTKFTKLVTFLKVYIIEKNIRDKIQREIKECVSDGLY